MMIDHFNRVHDDIELSFSTLTFYDEMVGRNDEEMSSFYFDMMPFSESGTAYYTGLYSSRPNLK